ncbi:hypothetical protein POV22_22420, partial [Klebsiella pneumoniae]
MMSLWDALRMNMMISYQELVRTFLSSKASFRHEKGNGDFQNQLKHAASPVELSNYVEIVSYKMQKK